MKFNLYIDCDGVIFDTINYAFQNMKKLGINTLNEESVFNYFKNANWSNLINESGQINDSCQKILLLKAYEIFKDIFIATHHCSYEESIIKNAKFATVLPNITIFNIPKKIPKHFALKSDHSILVDDSLTKVKTWIESGGYGVLFDQNINGLIYPDNEKKYYITNDLLSLIAINDDIKSKTKIYQYKKR